ncbi:inactive histone-lysine N-methyltransferase 2E-like [Fundulus heteroclitus]|uniref:inactive histone-lysine N-methyltransferase 2E-like n=1 Tax=Fundulus heteroclitus TaxID=8078 RepID=UPI00165AEE14|nr:inactive histone-lysine N-methyltransferase 2E-like [Fundulus heteroclitus]
MQRRRRINPKEDAKYCIDTRKDRVGLDIKYINAFEGRGIFATTSFQKGDFLLEYRGELISKEECERRQRVYHDNLKVFMFEFVFNGKLWCVDAAKEDGSLGRLVNDDHIGRNAKLKYLTVQGKPHLCLFATQEINKGEEITYNYGDSDWPWRCKVEAENAPEQMEDSIPNETDPVIAVLPNNAEQDMEEKIFQSPEVTHLRSTPGNSEQVEAENAPEQMEDSISNETDPVIAVLPNNAEQDMEEKIFQSPEVTHLRSTPGNSEQVEAENAPEQMEDSISNETDPVIAVLPNNAECQKHQLVCTTVSSLEKCTECFGPCSSMKWLGYQCKGCSKVWHSYCLTRIKNDDPSQARELFKFSYDDPSSDEDSTAPPKQSEMSDDDHMSDKDYIPNSESDEDSDVSIPLQSINSQIGQHQGYPTIPDLILSLPDSR